MNSPFRIQRELTFHSGEEGYTHLVPSNTLQYTGYKLVTRLNPLANQEAAASE